MSSKNNHPTEYGPAGSSQEAPRHGAPEAETPQEQHTLELLAEAHGDAFRAYLTHIREDTPIDEVENEFINLYWASYPDRKTFIDSFLSGLGWQADYESLIANGGIPEGVLNWNYPLLLARLQEDYELLDLGGKVHVFFK
ncbi:MAG: hypothetical protein ACTH30_10245 [Leucobacter sp.]